MTGTGAQVFTDLRVWRAAHEFVLMVYKATNGFPKNEQFGLTSQMRRAAVSVSSNIAEGFGRTSPGDKTRFYTFSQGSIMELQNQFFIARDLLFITHEQADSLQSQATSVLGQLRALIRSVSTPKC